jgi:excisionase family DNA binding protein
MLMTKQLDQASQEWLGVQEAVKYTGYSAATLRRYDKRGVLVAARTPGGQRRYTREQLDTLRPQTPTREAS